ncbi:hypothetical protein PybrP1_001779, partial [[Pythium] brassicae (nom. inval.)]
MVGGTLVCVCCVCATVLLSCAYCACVYGDYCTCARTQVTPRFPLGTRVSKYFPGYTDPFAGMVDDYSTYSGFYHITYEDGDSEEMTEVDLEVHVVLPPPTASHARPAVESPKPKTTLVLNLNDKAPGAKATSSSKNAASSLRPGSGKSSPQGTSSSTATSPRTHSPTHSSTSAARPPSSAGDGPSGEVNNLIGRGISKVFVDADGRETAVNGTVSAYFIATRKYRVLFFNGHCEDLSYQDVLESLPLSSPSDEDSKKRKLTDDGGRGGSAAPSASPKKQKAMESSSSGVGGGVGRSSGNGSGAGSESTRKPKHESESDLSSSLGDLSPPFDTSQGLTKVFAHSITRNVLFLVVSSSSGATDEKKQQMAILTDGRLGVSDARCDRYRSMWYAKKALVKFVESEGLVTLANLLKTWMESKEAEFGLVVVLKVLAVLPGVTAANVISSRVGQAVKRISKSGASTGFEASTSDIATWLMENWKRRLVKSESKPDSHSHNAPAVKKKQMEQRDEKGDSKSSSLPKNGANGGATESAQPHHRSNSANHLQALLGSHNSRKSRDVLGSALSGKQRLGPAYAHRARRSTVVLDSVAQRCSKNAETSSAEKAAAAEADQDEHHPSRISFGESLELTFNMDVEVSRLLTWGPDGGRRKDPFAKPPPLTTKRLKSILRIPLAPAQPAGVAEQSDILVAPPVVQTVSVSSSAGAWVTRPGDQSGDAPPPSTAGESEPETPLFSMRREQTNRSPPPDFAATLDIALPSIADLTPASGDGADVDQCTSEKEQEERREQQQQQQLHEEASGEVVVEQEVPSKIS